MNANQLMNLVESANKLNAVMLHVAEYPNDKILFETLCERHNGFHTEYVVWTYNAEIDGFANGYYTTDWNDACDKLNKRIKK